MVRRQRPVRRRAPAPPRQDACWRPATPAGRPARRAAAATQLRRPAAAARRASGHPARSSGSSRGRAADAASVSLRGCTRAKPVSTCRASPGTRRQRSMLRSDRRALISMRRDVPHPAARRAGSATARSRRSPPRRAANGRGTGRTQAGTSSGAKRCSTRPAKCWVQPLLQQPGRGDCAGGQQDGGRGLRAAATIAAGSTGLADAGGMQPDQPTRRARCRVDAAALAQPAADLLALRDWRSRSSRRRPGAAAVAATAQAAAERVRPDTAGLRIGGRGQRGADGGHGSCHVSRGRRWSAGRPPRRDRTALAPPCDPRCAAPSGAWSAPRREKQARNRSKEDT